MVSAIPTLFGRHLGQKDRPTAVLGQKHPVRPDLDELGDGTAAWERGPTPRSPAHRARPAPTGGTEDPAPPTTAAWTTASSSGCFGLDHTHAGAESALAPCAAAGVVEGHEGAGGHQQSFRAPRVRRTSPRRWCRGRAGSAARPGRARPAPDPPSASDRPPRARLGFAPRPPVPTETHGDIGHRQIETPGHMARGRDLEDAPLARQRRARAER